MELLTPQQTAERIGVGKRTLLQRYAPKPDFPRRIAISRKVFFFNATEIDEWLQNQKEKYHSIKI